MEIPLLYRLFAVIGMLLFYNPPVPTCAERGGERVKVEVMEEIVLEEGPPVRVAHVPKMRWKCVTVMNLPFERIEED